MYQTVEFKRLLSLVPFATEFQLERAIVDVALANELQVCTFVDYSGTLVFAKHAQQSTIGRKIWLSMHPRNFGGHVTIHVCPYFNLSICTTRVPVSKLNLYKHNLFLPCWCLVHTCAFDLSVLSKVATSPIGSV